MDYFKCLDCERRKLELKAQLELLIPKIQQRAIDEQQTYGIYLDIEDKKLVAATIEDCHARGETPIEILSKYQ